MTATAGPTASSLPSLRALGFTVCSWLCSFFVKGRKFRQPAYLATSFSEGVARQFLAMRGGSDCVLWRVRSIPSSFCFFLPHSQKQSDCQSPKLI